MPAGEFRVGITAGVGHETRVVSCHSLLRWFGGQLFGISLLFVLFPSSPLPLKIACLSQAACVEHSELAKHFQILGWEVRTQKEVELPMPLAEMMALLSILHQLFFFFNFISWASRAL